MRKLLTTGLLAVAALALAPTLSGCASSTGPITVDHSANTATVSAGETLTIDFGEVNPSAGDGWVIVTKPDSAILSGGEQHIEPLSKDKAVGGPHALTFEFTAVAAGTTTVEFEYRTRGTVPESPKDQQSASLEVTVN